MVKVNKLKDPEELEILEFLHSQRPQSEYVIPPEGHLSSNIGPGFLLPLRQSVLGLFALPPERCGRFPQFADDLLKGVAFLHYHNVAHRDIKPDNLVYSDTHPLQIIDFDVAIRVRDVDHTVVDEGDVGELDAGDYEAPETQDSYGQPQFYSPIRADRWSCGRMVIEFLDRSGRRATYSKLARFAEKLMDDDPRCRPSLSEWKPDRKRSCMESTAVAQPKRRRVVENGENHRHSNNHLVIGPRSSVVC